MHFYADKELNQIRTICFIHLSFVHNYLNKMNYLELSYLKKKILLFFSYSHGRASVTGIALLCQKLDN